MSFIIVLVCVTLSTRLNKSFVVVPETSRKGWE
jgi:hypothetical protein